jgi:YHS domain-containing protein
MRLVSVSVAVLALSGAALALLQSAEKPSPQDALIARQLPSYPLDTCPVSGEELGGAMGAPVEFVHEGRLVRFCCKQCIGEFKKDPAPFLGKIDAAVVKAQKASYPLTKCPVSGKELASMSEPVDYVHGTRLVRFCCKDCPQAFQKDPAKTMAQIDKALIDAQKKGYPLTTCLISGKTIEGEGVDYLHGTRLVRFCCPKCPEAFQKDPAKPLAQLEAAAKKAKEASSPPGEKKGGY